MFLIFKGNYTIFGKIEFDESTNSAILHYKYSDNSIAELKINNQDNNMTVVYEKTVSDHLYHCLIEYSKGKDIFNTLIKKEFNKITNDITNAARKILEIIKYTFDQTQIDDTFIGHADSYWTSDKINWYKWPMFIVAGLHFDETIKLSNDNLEIIQNYINQDYSPIVALRHLHRAKNEKNNVDKWIEATIAAELAIKEYLILIKPEIKELILESPTPSLDKLYGKILKSFIGEESPKCKEIREGMIKRNQLIHRPIRHRLNFQDTSKYVQDVEIAIYHLLIHLYPSDKHIKEYYDKLMINDATLQYYLKTSILKYGGDKYKNKG